MKIHFSLARLFVVLLILSASCKKENGSNAGFLQLASVKVGTSVFSRLNITKDVVIDQPIIVDFNNKLDTNSVRKNFSLRKNNSTLVAFRISYQDDYSNIVFTPEQPLDNGTNYTLVISSGIKGLSGESFPGLEYTFITLAGKLTIQHIDLNG